MEIELLHHERYLIMVLWMAPSTDEPRTADLRLNVVVVIYDQVEKLWPGSPCTGVFLFMVFRFPSRPIQLLSRQQNRLHRISNAD